MQCRKRSGESFIRLFCGRKWILRIQPRILSSVSFPHLNDVTEKEGKNGNGEAGR